uniref:G-protein coupled receptors family 1 profile domain-containing protein n=1 Tax=Romanomermis culicivorax TaxID=13658 RepID=A0A915J8C1_ROMCU
VDTIDYLERNLNFQIVRFKIIVLSSYLKTDFSRRMTSTVNFTAYDSLPTPAGSIVRLAQYTNLESALIIYFAVVSVTLTVVGNGLVCLAVVLVRKLHQPPNYLLFSLALTDMAVGLLVEPLNVMYELNGSLNWISE